jgi:hypothetical protein
MIKGAAALSAVVVLAATAGCVGNGEAAHHEVHVVRAPDLTDIPSFDLVAYDGQHPSSGSASRLAKLCVLPDRGRLVQAAAVRGLGRLGVRHAGIGVGLLFQAGATTRQRQSVASCLQSHGATTSYRPEAR